MTHELDRDAVLAAIRAGDMWGLPLLAVADRVAARLDVSAASVEHVLVELLELGAIVEEGDGWGELHLADTPVDDANPRGHGGETTTHGHAAGGYAAIFADAQAAAGVPVWSFV